MDQVLLILKIDDYERWRGVAEEGAGNRKIMGSKEAFVYRDEANHNELVISYKWDDLANAHKFFESSEFKEWMENSGVKGKPEIHYIEDMDRLIG